MQLPGSLSVGESSTRKGKLVAHLLPGTRLRLEARHEILYQLLWMLPGAPLGALLKAHGRELHALKNKSTNLPALRGFKADFFWFFARFARASRASIALRRPNTASAGLELQHLGQILSRPSLSHLHDGLVPFWTKPLKVASPSACTVDLVNTTVQLKLHPVHVLACDCLDPLDAADRGLPRLLAPTGGVGVFLFLSLSRGGKEDPFRNLGLSVSGWSVSRSTNYYD